MPMYEYHCQACNIYYEELMPADAVKAPMCPRCKTNDKCSKIPSGVSIKTRAASPIDRGIPPMRNPYGGGGGCPGSGGGFS